MKRLILLPHAFRRIGVAVFAIGAIVGALMTPDGYDGWPSFLLPADKESPLFAALVSNSMTHLLNNIAIIGLCVGSIFIACSRERIEDEMTGAVRLNALLTALYVNIAAAVIASLVLYDFDYLYVMVVNLVFDNHPFTYAGKMANIRMRAVSRSWRRSHIDGLRHSRDAD